ncbi:MAG: HAD family hydrolase [Candidatus Electrothrix sp. AR4]|nr:HAD family hydrolase [Candidatus Electrothrix sp. AR4]
MIFDFDGTIADSFSRFVVISNKLAKEFNFRVLLPENVDELRSKGSREVLRDLQIPLLKLPVILARAKKEFSDVMSEIQVFPGVKEVLFQLKEQNREIGLLTSNSLDNVHCFLESNELDFFDFLYTSSGLLGKKRQLKKVIDTHKFDVNELLYIGDETRDIEASRNLGVRIASVAWGYNTLQALKRLYPDYLINTPQDLLMV